MVARNVKQILDVALKGNSFWLADILLRILKLLYKYICSSSLKNLLNLILLRFECVQNVGLYYNKDSTGTSGVFQTKHGFW